jgi:hypothetical protein
MIGLIGQDGGQVAVMVVIVTEDVDIVVEVVAVVA